MQTHNLITEAQNILFKTPYDLGHDIFHHFKVWENCLEITSAENLKQVKLDLLQIAAWWHDVNRKDKTHPEFVSCATKLKIPTEQIDEILNIINAHSYRDDRSEVLEAKILFDADKIEYIGFSRYFNIMSAIKNGEMALERGLKYADAINERITYVVNNINFRHAMVMIKDQYDKFLYLKAEKILLDEISERIDWKKLDELFNPL